MKHTNKKNLFGYVAVTLVLAMAVVSSVSLIQMNATAGAEAVTISEKATIVTSPFTEAVKAVRDSVVGVNNYTRYSRNSDYYGFGYGFGGGYGGNNGGEENSREVLQGSGSGVVVAAGYVLTNYHVVEGATTLEVTSGDKVYPAELMGADEAKDIAVMKVEGLDIQPVVLGDSDMLSVGDWAICIGNPLSFSGTTTVGVISALNREVASNATDAYGKRSTNTMIQTDAAINSGNSGGGMFNVAGELIGIPSMKYTGSAFTGNSVEGIGMAIPINEAKGLINDVLSGNGNVKSNRDGSSSSSSTDTPNITAGDTPRMGVGVTNMNTSHPAVANGILPKGAYISNVEKDSPAEKAGIQIADIVVEIDGNVIATTTQMTSYLQNKQAGDVVDVKVYRVEGGLNNAQGENIPDGEYIDLKVELAILDAAQP